MIRQQFVLCRQILSGADLIQLVQIFLGDLILLVGNKIQPTFHAVNAVFLLIAGGVINPIIGDMEVQAVTPRAVDGYIQTLQKTKSVSTAERVVVFHHLVVAHARRTKKMLSAFPIG